MTYIFKKLASRYPFLEFDLKLARWNITPEEFVKKAFINTVVGSLGLTFVFFTLFQAMGKSPFIAFLLFIPIFFMLFFYSIHLPKFRSITSKKYVDIEIISMIRFLILELKSGRTLFDALKSVSSQFNLIGIYMDEIVNEVELGSDLETVIRNKTETISSGHLRSVLWQVLNSLQTGSDITHSLETALEDIIEEQKIELVEYGRELNALSLFYMMVAIIMPTIGITIITAILTFVGIAIEMAGLITGWIVLSLVQYIFLILSMNRRPAVEA